MKHKFCFSPHRKWCQGNGLYCPGPGDIVAYFTQVALDGNCVIPEPKPDAEKLVSEHCTVINCVTNVVDVMEFENGHRYPGRKVVISGIFRLGIEYSAKVPVQTVHFFHCDIPFNAIIMMCQDGKEVPFPFNFQIDDYVVHVCLEHIDVEQVTERSFKKEIVIMVWLQQKTSHIPDEGKGDDDELC